MSYRTTLFRNGQIFDGQNLKAGHAALIEDGALKAIAPEAEFETVESTVDLAGDILSPGYIDLQVNGGGGVMFNEVTTAESLQQISDAHRSLGTMMLLPTLITDTPDVTAAAIDAAIRAIKSGVPGIAGLHLEGPHLSIKRKGAHDPNLIRAMGHEDLDRLLAAAEKLPVLKVTIAPESVTEEQVRLLSGAGVLVSLGHSDADYDTSQRYVDAGARCVTHLFNAMSQIGNREPGLVGAAIANGGLHTGIIADGVHVHPQVIRTAWHSKAGPGQVFLVSDAMSVAGTNMDQFRLGNRLIKRQNGRLTLADGTLAGADLDLTSAIKVLVDRIGIDLEAALRAATSIPAKLIGNSAALVPDENTHISRIIRISKDLTSAAPLDSLEAKITALH